MPREIKAPTDPAVGTTTIVDSNNYKDRLVKLIPSEIVTAYITIQGLLSGNANVKLFTLIAFVCLLVLTPFYLLKVGDVKKIGQLIFSTVAFVVWVMATGGFLVMFPAATILDQTFGSLVLIIYTLVIPIVYKG